MSAREKKAVRFPQDNSIRLQKLEKTCSNKLSTVFHQT